MVVNNHAEHPHPFIINYRAEGVVQAVVVGREGVGDQHRQKGVDYLNVFDVLATFYGYQKAVTPFFGYDDNKRCAADVPFILAKDRNGFK